MRKLSTDLIKSGSFTGSFSGSVIGTITSASFASTASYLLNSFSLNTGSTYPITSSWSNNSISSSFSNTSISSSYSLTSSNLSPVAQDLIPTSNSLYSLGSPTNKWKDLYVSTGSIYIGEVILSTSGSTLYADVNPIVTLNTASGQIEISGISTNLSSSYSNTSSIALNAISSSYASTASISVSSSFATTSSYNLNSISSSYSLTASFASNAGSSLTTGSTYPITSSWANNAITASFAMNGGGSTTITNWTSSSLTSSVSTSSIAAFNSTGSPILVSPPSDNTYLVYQNGILKWIPIASVAVSFLNSVFSQEIDIKDGQYNISIVPVAQYTSDFSQEIDIKDGQYDTSIISTRYTSDFNQEIDIKDGQYNISIVPVAQYISSFTSGSI